MSTREFIVDDSIYVEISNVDCVIENVSSYLVRLVYGDVLPETDTKDFHPLRPTQIVKKIIDHPDGKIFVRADQPNRNCMISVSDAGESTSSGQNDISLDILSEVRHLRAITQYTYNSDITKADIESDEC